MTGAVVSNNTGKWGGGIYQAKGEVELVEVKLNDNTSTWGGGFYLAGGQAKLVDTTFSGNKSNPKYGSGIAKTAKSQLTVIKNNETILDTALLQYIDDKSL